MDITQINREIRNIEEYITQNKSTTNYYEYRSLRGTVRNEESVLSSVVSETPEAPKKQHYSKKNLPKGGGTKKPREEGNRSANCDVTCNMF